MPMLHLKRPHRVFAALVALCYCWLSVSITFEHNHDLFAHEAEALLSIADAVAGPNAALPLNTHLSAHPVPTCAAHCIACEWQAANVSPALLPVALRLTLPASPRALTTFPRSLRLLALRASSRAPPLT
jgi:hypothetical protein